MADHATPAGLPYGPLPRPPAPATCSDPGSYPRDPESGPAICDEQPRIVTEVCCGRDPDWTGQWWELCESIFRIEQPYTLPTGPLYEAETSAQFERTHP